MRKHHYLCLTALIILLIIILIFGIILTNNNYNIVYYFDKTFSVIEVAKIESSINGIIAGFTITIIVLLLSRKITKKFKNWFNYSIAIFILAFFTSLLCSFLYANVSGEMPNESDTNYYLILMPPSYLFVISSVLFILGISFTLNSFKSIKDNILKLVNKLIFIWIMIASVYYLYTLNLAVFFPGYNLTCFFLNLIIYSIVFLFIYIIKKDIYKFFTYTNLSDNQTRQFFSNYYYYYIIITAIIISCLQIRIQDFDTDKHSFITIEPFYYHSLFYVVFGIYNVLTILLIPQNKK